MKNEHVKPEFTNHEQGFSLVMERLKNALGLKVDSELAKALGMSPSNFSNKKRLQSVPYEAVLSLCKANAVSLDWLFSGAGEAFTDSERHVSDDVASTIDPKLLATVLYELEVALGEGGQDVKSRAEHVVRLGLLAVAIYNKTVFVKSEKMRRNAIRDEARDYAAVARLLGDERAIREG